MMKKGKAAGRTGIVSEIIIIINHHHRTSMAPFTKYSSANGALQYEST